MEGRKSAAVAAANLDKKMPADSQEQTVEEYLKAHCNQLVEDLNSHAEGLIQNLQQELEKGKAEIMALAQENSGAQSTTTDNSTTTATTTSTDSTTTTKTTTAAAAAAAPLPTTTATMTNILLIVKEGPYADTKFHLLQTKTRKEFIIGRSTGKKVKDHGVSLPQDPEVSTVHGKIECKGKGKVVFEDLGSTNGSFLNGASVEERVSQVLKTGDILKLGGTIVEVQLQPQDQGESQ